jgi:hypothetical protein
VKGKTNLGSVSADVCISCFTVSTGRSSHTATGKSKALLDDELSESGFQAGSKVCYLSYLTFATHGLFSPDPEEKFIATEHGKK